MHTEPITFIHPCTEAENRKIGNAYYHVNSVCIRKKHPSFTTQLVCPKDVQVLLRQSHQQFLYNALGFVLPPPAF